MIARCFKVLDTFVSSVEQYTPFLNNVNNLVYLNLMYSPILDNYILNNIVILVLEFIFVKNIDYIQILHYYNIDTFYGVTYTST